MGLMMDFHTYDDHNRFLCRLIRSGLNIANPQIVAIHKDDEETVYKFADDTLEVFCQNHVDRSHSHPIEQYDGEVYMNLIDHKTYYVFKKYDDGEMIMCDVNNLDNRLSTNEDNLFDNFIFLSKGD